MTILDEHLSKQYDKILDYAIMNRLMLGGSSDHSAADRVLAKIAALKAMVANYEDVMADHRRLVRELDVLLNGIDGAAKQASLCDLVAQVAKWRESNFSYSFTSGGSDA